MDSQEALDLYISFKDDSKSWLDLHHKHFSQSVTLILAILTATLAATYKFLDNRMVVFSVSIGPLVNVLLSLVGVGVCDRFYRRFLEHEAISNRFFSLYRRIVNRRGSRGVRCPEPMDLFPGRWIHAQASQRRIDEFADLRMGEGSNKHIRRSFYILAVLNLVVWAFLNTIALGPLWRACIVLVRNISLAGLWRYM